MPMWCRWVVWAREGEKGEERLISLVAIERLRVHPGPVLCFPQGINDSNVGNQDYSPSCLSHKKNVWDCGRKEDAFFLSFNILLPSPRQTAATHRSGLPAAPRCCPGPSFTEGGCVCIRAARNQSHGFTCKKKKKVVIFFWHW